MGSSKQRTHAPPEKIPDKKSAHLIHRTPSKPETLSPAINSDSAVGVTPKNILNLQQTRGNQYVMRALAQRNPETVQRLPDAIEGAMRTLFDVDVPKVGIRTDSHADQVARLANTDALTIGQDIYFRRGAYRPNTANGNAVIAREISHIQRAKMTGSADTTSGTAQADAQEVGALFQSMGANPAEILRPAPNGKASKAQRGVLQRAKGSRTQGKETSGMRTAGIVTSKAVQGLFTTVLGPVGLLWRGPLIQKKVGEIWGRNIGYRSGNKDDRQRYGETKFGTLMRWLATTSEILKEFTIWLGFATFIAAIVTAATHGAAAPVFLGLGIATAATAGVHAVLRGLLAAMNGYRLYKISKTAEGDGPKAEKARKKLPFIKHQLINDGLEGIGAAISSLLSGLGAGGVGSIGGDIAKSSGHSVATDSLGRLISFGGGMTTGVPTSVGLGTFNEGGKEIVKPSSERKTGKNGQWRNFKAGFMKDGKDMQKDWNERWTKTPDQPQNQQDQSIDPIQSELPQKVNDIAVKGGENLGEQRGALGESKDNSDLIQNLAPKVGQISESVKTSSDQMNLTEKKEHDLQQSLPELVDNSVKNDDNEAKKLSQEVKTGLKTPDPSHSSSDDSGGGLQMDDINAPQEVKEKQGGNVIDLKRVVQRDKKGGVGSRIKNWFAAKLGNLKAGVQRLNNKILVGVLKFAGKFNKNEADRQVLAAAMSEESKFASQDVQQETENEELFAEFQEKSGELRQGVSDASQVEA